MDNYKILQDVYKDFFGSDIKLKEDTQEELIEEINIDSLFISEESKELLNKIILYMKNYNLKEETNYINFNILIESKDENTINDIISILKSSALKYKYTKNDKVSRVSLYSVVKEDVSEFYKNGIVCFSQLNALNMNDTNFKKKFIYNFKSQLNSNSITILSGTHEELEEFLFNDNELENYFCFKLSSITPSVNDVYNYICNKINLSDEKNIKLLDYITNNYPKTNLSFSSYVEKLYDYITFNKDIPQLEINKTTEEVFEELNDLVGLEKVKKTLNDLVDLIKLKDKTKGEVKINSVNLHMVFLGNPGTGKTTVARLIASILYNLKYISQNKLIEVSSKDLVAEYVGQTAVKTMNVIEKAMGGILFIDEAYSLAVKDNTNSYNAECIATLIKAMEDYRDNLIVIFAGYTKEMQDFLNSNSGIVSRIGYTLEFDDYTNEELIQIFKGMVLKSGFELEDDALDVVDKLINENRNTKNFGNARFIRNVYERSVIKHASNTKNIKNKKKLKTITKNDITY
ncbi:MAG: AAA family ATPase [bacterium]|nr:AAA family ATPase [bacterium]